MLFSFRCDAIKKLSGICSSYEEACIEADILIEHFTGITKKELFLDAQLKIASEKLSLLNKKLELRINKRIPLQYITNKAYFYGLAFYVEPEVLIPRRDTEILVETAITQIKQNNYKKIAEIGSGSGCISISILKNTQNTTAIATDISEKALEVTQLNAYNNDVVGRLKLVKTSYLENVEGPFDAILSNPPYIPISRFSGLTEEVKNCEPQEALFVSNENPLIGYEAILKQGIEKLFPGGYIAVEIDSSFCEEVYELFKTYYYKKISIIKDYNSLSRVISGVKAN